MKKAPKTKSTISHSKATNLFFVALQDNDEAIKKLVENKADVNERSTMTGETPLHYAATANGRKAIKALIELKANVNAKTENHGKHFGLTRGTPLHLAATELHAETIQLLTSAKADPNSLDELNDTPLHNVAHYSYDGSGKQAIQALLDARANPTIKGNHGLTPAEVAYGDHEKITGDLLAAAEIAFKKTQPKQISANPTEVPKKEPSVSDQKSSVNSASAAALSAASKKKRKNKKKKKAGEHAIPVVNSVSASTIQYFLFEAVFYGRLEEAKLAIKNGAGVNIICGDYFTLHNRQTLLYIATYKGDKAMVELLLENKADVNQQVGDGSTPLLMACQKGHVEITALLLKYNAKLDITDNDGELPIVVAAGFGMTKIVAIFLAKGAHVNSVNNNAGAAFPLFVACQAGHIGTAKFLLAQGASVNQTRSDKTSSLHIAAFSNQVEVVKLLIKEGADVNAKNEEGFTALCYALEKNNYSIRDILIAAMSYQQIFIQNVNYILLEEKKMFPKGFAEEQFIQRLMDAVTSLTDSDEVFRKIVAMLKTPEYSQVKERLISVHKSLVAHMKKYNEYKYREIVAKTLTHVGLMVKGNTDPIDVVLEYCNLPTLKH